MTGAYLTRDGGATWRIINLGETVSSFFAFDPLDANVIYACAGGLFRSVDARRYLEALLPARRLHVGTGRRPRLRRPAVAGGRVHRTGHRARDRSRRLALALPRSGVRLSGPLRRWRNWQRSADLPGPARRIWIDTAFAARRPDALCRRTRRALHPHARESGAPRRFPEPPRRSPVRRRYSTPPSRARFTFPPTAARPGAIPPCPASRERPPRSRPPRPSRDRLRLLQRTARARPHHLGRGQDHRFRPPLGDPSTIACATPG